MSFFQGDSPFSSSKHMQFSSSTISRVSVLQNMTEPVFYVPNMPDFVQVAEPLPSKNPPPAGHDMKTLRKQIEFLYSEVQYRTENYNSVIEQNQQLWQYITQLFEANKDNAMKMREYVRGLSDELKLMYKERLEYSEKLALAKNAQEMLLSLNKELEESSLSKEELDRRRKEAQAELIKARKEREDLQEMLQEKLHQVENYQSLLNEYRIQKYEEEAFDRADDFFFSNKIVLKSAYARFKKGVKRRLRQQKIFEICQKLRFTLLKTQCWQQWIHYHRIEQFAQRSLETRNKETLLLFFTKWKVFRALETLFHRAQRKYLLTSCFSRWTDYLQEKRSERRLEDRLIEFEGLRVKKQCFQKWKSSVMFLLWYHPRLRDLEAKASRYFLFKLFRSWHAVIVETSELQAMRLERLRLLRLRNCWSGWREVCHRLWKMRGQLLRRFFNNLRHRLGNNLVYSKLSRQATVYFLTRQKRKAVARLKEWRRLRVSRRQSLQSTRVVKQKTAFVARTVRQVFMQWQYSTAVGRRQRLSDAFSVRYRERKLLVKAWQRLEVHLLLAIRAKRFELKHRFQTFRLRLRDLQRRNQRIAWLQTGIRSHRDKMDRFHLLSSLQKWLSELRSSKYHRLIGSILKQKWYRLTVVNSWNLWKHVFSRRVYWKWKEEEVEKQRLLSLVSLYEKQLVEVCDDHQKAVTEKEHSEETILQLQELIASKSNLLEQQLATIRQQETAKTQAEEIIQQLRRQIEDLTVERQQWKLLEQSYTKEKEKETIEREKKRQETLSYLQSLQKDSLHKQTVLQHDLSEFSQQETELKTVLQDLSDLLSDKEQEKSLSLMSLQESEEEVKQLESDEESLTIELERVQKKMKEVAEESKTILRDNQRQLRERVSAVRVLKEDSGLIQARVTGLEEIAETYHLEKGKMDMKEIQEKEVKEMSGLEAIREQHSQKLQSILSPADLSLEISPQRKRVASFESKESTLSSVEGREAVRVQTDQRFDDARNAIKMLSSRLSHSLQQSSSISPLAKK